MTRIKETKLIFSSHLHGHDRLHVLVQLVDERDSGGEVEAHDLVVGHVVQMLDDAAEGVPVGGDQDLLAILDLEKKGEQMVILLFYDWKRN